MQAVVYFARGQHLHAGELGSLGRAEIRRPRKEPSIRDPQFRNPPTCAHVERRKRNRELTHVMIQQDRTVIKAVRGILRAGSVQAWCDSLGPARSEYVILLPDG